MQRHHFYWPNCFGYARSHSVFSYLPFVVFLCAAFFSTAVRFQCGEFGVSEMPALLQSLSLAVPLARLIIIE